MTIFDTDDTGLRTLIHDHLKVFAKFTSSRDCEVCELLSPHFEKFAQEAAYEGIYFIRLDSDQNPVARKLMNERVAPFFVSYCQGRMIECDTRSTDGEVREQLDRLRAFMPIPGV
ncbi:thioredoxin family protein [Hymenobacter latericus]|uniref:thioredoxin family protein n=1 Tax=Hymenobacter sp. YIM 151858-1 TaxID=2987688 RepID=UPI0022275B88|nr:thioredoxin family protein [Hymenobacter sp. YIM 151858-1]UYZ60498.1 thioredoxin family protein [Hymenobacter sp. YIM 151858-1]